MKVPKNWIINGKEIEGIPSFLSNIAGKGPKETKIFEKPSEFPVFADSGWIFGIFRKGKTSPKVCIATIKDLICSGKNEIKSEKPPD